MRRLFDSSRIGGDANDSSGNNSQEAGDTRDAIRDRVEFLQYAISYKEEKLKIMRPSVNEGTSRLDQIRLAINDIRDMKFNKDNFIKYDKEYIEHLNNRLADLREERKKIQNLYNEFKKTSQEKEGYEKELSKLMENSLLQNF